MSNWVKEASGPVLLFLHLIGFQALRCPKYFLVYKICRLAWNIPKILFFISLIVTIMMEIAILWFLKDIKSQFAMLMKTVLQISAHLYLFRFRCNFRLLLTKISNISRKVFSDRNVKTFVITYYCFMIEFVNLAMEIARINSALHASYKHRVFASTLISAELNWYVSFAIDSSFIPASLSLYLPSICLSSYYFFVCLCMKNFLTEFVSKSQSLLLQYKHRNMLNIYKEVTEAIAYADNFLSYYAFIFVIVSLSGLFWLSYIFAFLMQGDYYSYIFIVSGFIYYSLILLSVMLSAAAVNKELEIAKSTVKLMRSWIPQRYRDSHVYLTQRLKPTVEMTLWKVYKDDKSLICSLGTLLTYGMLLGTLGSVHNQNGISSDVCMKKE